MTVLVSIRTLRTRRTGLTTMVVAAAFASTLVASTLVAVSHSAPPRVGPHRVVSCWQAVDVDPPASPSPSDRVLFGRVALPSEDYPGRLARRRGRLRYWAKAGILVRATPSPVDLIVPRAFRKRVAIAWGRGGPTSWIRILGCRAPEWLVYTGGFYARAPLCAELIVRTAGMSTRVRFALGRSCPP